MHGLPLNIKPQPMKNNYLKMPSKNGWRFFDIIIDTSKVISDRRVLVCTDEHKLTQVQLESVIG